LCLTAAIGFDPMAFPEHVHESTDEHGAVHAIAHRHVEAHAVVAHGHEEGRVLDHDDTVIALDQAFTVPRTPHPPQPAVRASSASFDAPAFAPMAGVAEFIERFTHGPPRTPPTLRGPPALSRL
jgi:hypothetical protein